MLAGNPIDFLRMLVWQVSLQKAQRSKDPLSKSKQVTTKQVKTRSMLAPSMAI
jgi:hypothetical protein